MKSKIIVVAALFVLLYANNCFAQPVGGAVGITPPSAFNSTLAWFRGGNLPVGAGGVNNVFGTMFNSGIYTKTNSILRSKLNGTVAYNINGFVAPRDGFMLLGPDAPVAGGTLYNTKGAFSLLHLNGTTALAAIELGYRPWMRTGISFTENSDLMYVGRKSEGTTPGTADQTDAVISWADDGSGPPFFGPDNMRFLFTSGNASTVGSANGDLTGLGMDGREIMRMTAIGNIGVGPRFDNTFQPTSTFHQHQENNLSSWMQITNQTVGNGVLSNLAPTIITANDGLRWGILGASTVIQNGNAFMYNQEQRHIIFSTGNNIPGSMAITNERVRITAIENPTTLVGGLYGVFNPGAKPTNTTRMTISENPTAPITRPVSLLHLGYDVGYIAPGSLDGWRSWMDIGTFTGSGYDNIYVGLKQEGFSADKNDAVINWGDDQISSPFSGPDHLRFIFTANATGSGGGSSPATGPNGLECGRFYPGRDTLGTFGRFGVGDFTATGVNQEPTHKLDVIGNGRFRLLPDSIYRKDTLVKKIVFVDSLGVLRWEYIDSLSIGLGSPCGDSTSMLISDRQVPMNDFNFYWTGQGVPTTNAIGLGYTCGVPMPGKLSVLQQNIGTVGVGTIAGSFINRDKTNASSLAYVGVSGISDRPQTGNTFNLGGDFVAGNSSNAYAVRGTIRNTVPAQRCVGGSFSSQSSFGTTNIGVYGIATSSPGGINYGVFGETDTTGTGNYAGYFVGNVLATGTITPSDVNLKENIDTIRNADSVLALLKPVYFNYKQTGDAARLNFPTSKQMGLIAQEVETVIPNIVTEAIHPAQYDTAGVVIAPSFTYKAVDYQKIIPLLISGYKGQQAKIDSLKDENSVQDSINTYLHSRDSILEYRLDQLESALNACCNAHSMQQNSNSNNAVAMQDVTLKDGQAIILEQNVPNPFAEQTTINYFLPENVVKAQMLFYNADGKLIQSADLTERGKGSLNVFAQDLSNGIYTCTLVVDGKVIETKKMVKQR